MDYTYTAVLIAVMAVVTLLLRVIPFLVFHGEKVPSVIVYLGDVLPYAAIGMLVVYCLRNVDFASASHGIPELTAVFFTATLQIWKKNSILSILGGTLLYMFLIHVVFTAGVV